jgi:hypothetical protein
MWEVCALIFSAQANAGHSLVDRPHILADPESGHDRPGGGDRCVSLAISAPGIWQDDDRGHL